MGEKASNNSKKLPLKKKIIPRVPRIHIDMPRIVARQDETYRPVRQLNLAVNLNYEKLKDKAESPKERAKISNAQENYNVKQSRHQLVVTRGLEHTKKEKQQHKKEDVKRKKRQNTLVKMSSSTPYRVTNNIKKARENQALLWDKDKVDNARNMLNMVNRDFLVMPGYLSMISAYNPYTQSLEIGQTFSDATRLHGYVNAAQMATAAGMAPLKFGLSLGAMYAGNKLGDKAVDLGMKWFTPYNSWYDYANKKWGYNEQEALRSNPGGWILGGLGMFLGPKLANTKPFAPFEIWNESRLIPLSDEYITTFLESPKQLYALEVTKPVGNTQGGTLLMSRTNISPESTLSVPTYLPSTFSSKPTVIKGETTLAPKTIKARPIKDETILAGDLPLEMVDAYEKAVLSGNRTKALGLLEQAYLRSGVPKNEVTVNPDGSAVGWFHGSADGNHTVFRPGIMTSTNGGMLASELGLARGTHLTTDIPSAVRYAGRSSLIPEAKLEYKLPINWVDRLKASLGLFKGRRLYPTERIPLELVLDPLKAYTTFDNTYEFIRNVGSATDPVVYPMYVNPGGNMRTIDFLGENWNRSPINFNNNFAVTDEAGNILYSGQNKQQAYSTFNEHPITQTNNWKSASDIESEPFEYGTRWILNYDGPKLVRLDEGVVPNGISGAVHDSYRGGYTSLHTPNIKDSGGGRGVEYYPIDEFVAFDSNLMKLADITYDSNGRLIPLDLRFNWNNPDTRYGGERPGRNNYIWTYDLSNPHHITLHLSSKVRPNFRVFNVTDPKAINNGLTPEAEAELAKRANWLGDSFLLAKDRLANGGYERLRSTALEVVNLGEGQLIYNNRTGEFIELRPRNYYYADEFLGRDLNDMLNVEPEYMSSTDYGNGLTGENIAVSHTDRDGKHIIVFNDRPYEYLVSNLATSDLIGHEFEHYTHHPFEKLPEDVYRPLSAYYRRYGNTEVAARIGLIKAYYGLKEWEPITGDHFRYAEKHFVEDRGYDNGMTTFFKGIVDYDKLAEWANRNVLGIAVPLGIGLGIGSLE